jgi:hypothetical protein
MLNGEFLNRQAEAFARRLRREAPGDTREQICLAFRLITARSPRAAEVRRGEELIDSLQREGVTQQRALVYFCLMVLNLNEFVYLD